MSTHRLLLECVAVALLRSVVFAVPQAACVGEELQCQQLLPDDSDVILLQSGLQVNSNRALTNSEDSRSASSTAADGTQKKAALQTWQSAFAEDPEMFTGCSQIFLDIGANRGTHVRKLFEPEKYPLAPYRMVFDMTFGNASHRAQPSNQTGICAFAFEANPRWTTDLKAIETAYAKKGWTARFFVPNAVSDHKGTANLTMDARNTKYLSDWGATTLEDDAVLGVEIPDSALRTVAVPASDLSSFMQIMVTKADPGYRLMKMDIEGGEYDVLPSLKEDGLLCKPNLHLVTIEWHLLTNSRTAKTKKQILNQDMCTEGGTEFLEFDDESYLNDGMLLP